MSKDIFTNKSDLENDDLQIKSFLKENNNLKVPIEISIGIDAVLRDLNSDISKETPKKTNGILSKVAMVALIALSLTIATSIVNPTLVKAMPVVGKIFDFFSGESANKFNDASILIGMSAKDKGITVTLEEASMDSEKFMATLKVTGKSFNTNKIDVEVGGSANNRRFSPSSSTIKRIDDTTVVVLFEGTLSDINISEKVHLELYIGGILIDDKEINGDWNFSTTIDADEILVPSKEIKSMDEVTIEDYKVRIEKFTTSPLSTNVNAKCVFNNYNFLNKSETDILNDSNNLFTVGYIFKDSLGNILLSKEIEASCDLNTMEYNMKSEILGDLSYSEYIDVIPVLRGKAEMSYYDENGDMLYQCISDSPQANFEKISIGNNYYNMDINNRFLSIDELKGKTIEVNNTGSVSIKDVEATDSYTKITVNISDYYDIRFLGFMGIIDEDFNVCNNEGFNMGPVVENSSEKEISVTLPQLDKSKKYTISLPRILDLNIDDANKIRVNLN